MQLQAPPKPRGVCSNSWWPGTVLLGTMQQWNRLLRYGSIWQPSWWNVLVTLLCTTGCTRGNFCVGAEMALVRCTAARACPAAELDGLRRRVPLLEPAAHAPAVHCNGLVADSVPASAAAPELWLARQRPCCVGIILFAMLRFSADYACIHQAFRIPTCLLLVGQLVL
jgi:hypothetical protein